jgi:tetratricopeptide (TPR) repeat protein
LSKAVFSATIVGMKVSRGIIQGACAAGLLAAFTLLLGACASTPVQIDQEATAMVLLQRGQEAIDSGHYDDAIQYFEAIKDRFPDDIDMVCNAEYEIGRSCYKAGRYGQARETFSALLARYSARDAELLPPQFKVLAQIGLDNVAKKTGTI